MEGDEGVKSTEVLSSLAFFLLLSRNFEEVLFLLATGPPASTRSLTYSNLGLRSRVSSPASTSSETEEYLQREIER